jgi:hypothetical protein
LDAFFDLSWPRVREASTGASTLSSDDPDERLCIEEKEALASVLDCKLLLAAYEEGK